MESYTNSNPQFSSSINIVETTDPVHADLVNAAPKQLLEDILVLLDKLNEHLNDKDNPHNITAESINAIAKSALGAANGVAKLDEDGIVPVENGGTGGNSGITAANSLQVAALAGGAAIAEGTDLDTLTVPGTYAATSAAVAATLLHSPINTSGFLLYTLKTYHHESTGPYRTQIIICGSNAPTTLWIRNLDGFGKWYDWVQVKYTDTTYSNMTAATASAAGKAGLVPAPAAGAQAKYLRGDGTWQTPPDTTYANFVKSGSGAKAGLVPAPSTTAGTTKYLREDGTWAVPPDNNTTYSNMVGATASAAGKAGLVPAPGISDVKYALYSNGAWLRPYVLLHGEVSGNSKTFTPLYTSTPFDILFILSSYLTFASTGSFYGAISFYLPNVSTSMTAVSETIIVGSSTGNWKYSVAASGAITITSPRTPWQYSVLCMPR